MAGELVSFGVQKLWDLLSQEYEQFQGVEDQVTELKDNLDLLKSFLKDADAKKHTNERVRHCVEKIKEIVYDAEDIIETFILKEKVGKQIGIMKRIRRFACTILDRRELASDIGGISKRISKVIQDMQSFGVQQMIIDGSRSSHPLQERQREMRQTFPKDYESDIVGLEANVKKLVGYLVEKDDIQIISVTGMGGLGKTTLARHVFNHEDVKQQFNQRLAWVCVSQEFTRISVWQTILQNLTSKERKDEILKMKEAELQGELFRLLETCKSLIVFDDIWKEEDWDLIKPIFPPKKGWKVLLTSRNEFVSMRGDMTYNFKPECLTIEDSLKLFKSIAMPRKDAPEFKEMEEMGKKMIKHCGGLPLAIKVLGGLLAATDTLHDWKRLSENIGSHLMGGRTDFNDDKNNSFNYVLSLSFEELPSYLRHCFLYLAHFPEDHKIDIEKLSYYWAAEGISEPRQYDGETIRDVGDSYIKELVRRNMVISEREATTLRFETCHLHDMMREVCLFKAKQENFLQITSSRPSTANFQSHVTSRRLVSHNPTTLHIERDINNPKLRSLVFVQGNRESWKLSGSSYTRLELLRVLDLFRAEFEGGKLPSGIGKLIHLRYLSLKDAEVSHLPSSLGNLLLLIYLNLDIRGSIFVPNVLMGMQELRYLALPRPMHKETKLELSNLEKLETLLHFSIKNSSVRDLDRMTKLRTLSIYTIGEGCATETLSSSLSELRRLEYLTISLIIYPLVEDPMPILEKLVHLKDLELSYQSFSGRRMVRSSGGFPQLQKLSIDRLEEWEEWLVEEGSMPLLYSLSIRHCPKLKKLHVGGFPQLQELIIGGLEEWEEWIVEEGSMPLLHFLQIYRCPKLKKLPAGRFPQLHTLELCELKEWEEWIVEEGSMPLLHTLNISGCRKLKKLHAGGFPQLHTLYLSGLEWEEWIVEEGSMPLLHNLTIYRCPKLKKLHGGFPQLHKLKLNGLEEWEEWIVEEGSMPLLHSLHIILCPKLKKLPAGGFPQLHTLYLGGLKEWEEWIVEEGSMSLLHKLTIHWCPKLKELPDGLRFIYSLKELRMDKEWKERLSEGGEDYYIVKHIPSVKFYEE